MKSETKNVSDFLFIINYVYLPVRDKCKDYLNCDLCDYCDCDDMTDERQVTRK